jgi:hypothetical protein
LISSTSVMSAASLLVTLMVTGPAATLALSILQLFLPSPPSLASVTLTVLMPPAADVAVVLEAVSL